MGSALWLEIHSVPLCQGQVWAFRRGEGVRTGLEFVRFGGCGKTW